MWHFNKICHFTASKDILFCYYHCLVLSVVAKAKNVPHIDFTPDRSLVAGRGHAWYFRSIHLATRTTWFRLTSNLYIQNFSITDLSAVRIWASSFEFSHKLSSAFTAVSVCSLCHKGTKITVSTTLITKIQQRLIVLLSQAQRVNIDFLNPTHGDFADMQCNSITKLTVLYHTLHWHPHKQILLQ